MASVSSIGQPLGCGGLRAGGDFVLLRLHLFVFEPKL
jgi:hypothetical protein